MQFKLIAKTPIQDYVTTFEFEPEQQIQWKPGQYFHYKLPHENPDDRGIERWFTNSAAPFEKNPRITTRFAQDRSSTFKIALNKLEIGQSIEADGPEGDFVIEDFSKRYVFISGGIGITPFRSMFAQFKNDSKQIKCDLLYANRDENYVFEQEIIDFAQTQNDFRLHKFTGDRKIEDKDFKELFPNLNEFTYYISGPKPMVTHYKELLISIGVINENIKLDNFPGYEQI